MTKENRLEIWLNRALEMENRGRDFYQNVAKKAADSTVADFFNMLADQELAHIKVIKNIFSKIDEGDKCWLGDNDGSQNHSSGLNQLFKTISAQRPGADADIVEAIEKGMEFEGEARQYYEQQIPLAGCEDEKNFLTRLAAEENAHLQMLGDMKLYYSDPESWNLEQDNMHIDGV